MISNLEESLALTELKLTDGGLELATAALPESQIHLMKKELDEQDLVKIYKNFLSYCRQNKLQRLSLVFFQNGTMLACNYMRQLIECY